MSDEDADFIRAIAAQPEDDNVRLDYADWLTENGDLNRAELIRLQCNLERGIDWKTGKKATAERLKELPGRETELIKEMLAKDEQHGVRELTPELASIVSADTTRISFRRGMIKNLNLTNSHITELPQGLYVGGNLYLVSTRIRTLPPDLHVGGNLDLTHSHITETTARSILTMPNLSREAKITGLQSIRKWPLSEQARRLPETKSGPGTPPRP